MIPEGDFSMSATIQGKEFNAGNMVKIIGHLDT